MKRGTWQKTEHYNTHMFPKGSSKFNSMKLTSQASKN